MVVPVLSGLRTIADSYDGFILDVWGVLHDGVAVFPGVIDALTALAERNKRVALLSNAPRRTTRMIAQLASLGIERALYTVIHSSGEAVHAALTNADDPWFSELGPNCLQMGSVPVEPLLDDTAKRVTAVEAADFVLNTGPDTPDERFEDYAPLLAAAAARRLPMICANPDLVVMVGGKVELCAGLLAQHYEKSGNVVRYIGKPYPAMYDRVLALLGIDDRRRVLAVGDSFHTDIQGAANAGLDSLFVSAGIHAAELGVRPGESPKGERVTALAGRHNLSPVAAIGGLIW
jgi:HAD superfamily hydrolase (TIGR01459 family)